MRRYYNGFFIPFSRRNLKARMRDGVCHEYAIPVEFAPFSAIITSVGGKELRRTPGAAATGNTTASRFH